MDSVSTISTNRSRTHSPRQSGKDDFSLPRGRHSRSRSRTEQRGHKRNHRSDSSMSRSRSPARLNRAHNKSRRHRTKTPEEDRGRPNSLRRGSHRSRSSSMSVDRSQTTKQRRSLDTDQVVTSELADGRDKRWGEKMPNRRDYHDPQQIANSGNARTQPHRQRSLSPYSRRLALTQSMNMQR